MSSLHDRFDQLSVWILECVGSARKLNEHEASARELLERAERELGGVRRDLAHVPSVTGGLPRK